MKYLSSKISYSLLLSIGLYCAPSMALTEKEQIVFEQLFKNIDKPETFKQLYAAYISTIRASDIHGERSLDEMILSSINRLTAPQKKIIEAWHNEVVKPRSSGNFFQKAFKDVKLSEFFAGSLLTGVSLGCALLGMYMCEQRSLSDMDRVMGFLVYISSWPAFFTGIICMVESQDYTKRLQEPIKELLENEKYIKNMLADASPFDSAQDERVIISD